MVDRTDLSYEIIYNVKGKAIDYITCNNMDFITALEQLKLYSEKYKNCRLLAVKTIRKEIKLDINKFA